LDEPTTEVGFTPLLHLVRGSLHIESRQRQDTMMRKKSKAEMEADIRRSDKWLEMVRTLQLGERVAQRVIKRRARKGIPDAVRGSAWPTLARSTDAIPAEYPKTFQGKQNWMKSMLNKQLTRKQLSDIFKDITRTLPSHVYF
jgi:hypothetical protein